MKREIKITKDGSNTLFINDLNESYHSTHGALQEAVYVFINNGFKLINNYEINILELGFGTGLNVLVTIDEYLKNDKNHIVNYYSMEKYPITNSEIEELDYPSLFKNKKIGEYNHKIHQCEWDKKTEILPNFSLTKLQADFFDLQNKILPAIDLVYFDCFGARVQPDLWEKPLLKMVADKMKTNALFTSYSSKGSMRRALQELNFMVTKKPGPPGKREMINAIKL